MIKIGAVWKQQKEDGTAYLKGRIDMPCAILLDGETDILLFKNKSEHEKAPYFDILIAKRKPRPDNQSQGSFKAESSFDDETPF